jgi:transposase
VELVAGGIRNEQSSRVGRGINEAVTEKIRIVLDGSRGEGSIANLCRHEGISQGIYYKWSKDFMEAGKKRLAGGTRRVRKILTR